MATGLKNLQVYQNSFELAMKIFEESKRLFKFHVETRLTINRIIDNWMKAMLDSDNRS